MALQVSIDTGGTHTDIVVINDEKKQLLTHKVPTTPGELSVGVLEGINSALERAGAKISEVDRLVYGTTLVTNIIIERDSVPVALITTENFRDVLAMGRAFRQENIYDLKWRPPEPLVPRYLRLGVRERINAAGEIVEPLDEESVRENLAKIVSEGVDTVSVCLLNSYANPVHEQRISAIAKAEFPQLRLSVSSEILREFREYERISTTVANAFVLKPIAEHLGKLEAALEKSGLKSTPYIMRANGGVMSFSAAKEKPVALTHSGPMGGIIGSSRIARESNAGDIITFDMGGTSSDVALIVGGKPTMTTRGEVAGLPVKLPALELVTVGAGGGSIAWVDDAGALKVGPKSAGARPGPACYGKGGTNPTVTDANLLLGRLNPAWFLAGKGTLDVDLARQAVQRLADKLGIGLMEAAFGIISISEGHMVNAIKLSSVKRGIDPRTTALVGFGGAGPLHVLGLANELGIKRAIVPVAPGNMSALGMLGADVTHDFVQSVVRDFSDIDSGELRNQIVELTKTSADNIAGEIGDDAEEMMLASADLRYSGQSHEINVPISDLSEEGLAALPQAFHAEHMRIYGYEMPSDPVQLVNLRMSAIGKLPKPQWVRVPDPSVAGIQDQRDVWFDIDGPRKVPVYRHEGLIENEVLIGPLVIEFTGSTLITPPNWTVKADAHGHLHLSATE